MLHRNSMTTGSPRRRSSCRGRRNRSASDSTATCWSIFGAIRGIRPGSTRSCAPRWSTKRRPASFCGQPADRFRPGRMRARGSRSAGLSITSVTLRQFAATLNLPHSYGILHRNPDWGEGAKGRWGDGGWCFLAADLLQMKDWAPQAGRRKPWKTAAQRPGAQPSGEFFAAYFLFLADSVNGVALPNRRLLPRRLGSRRRAEAYCADRTR
jgi:hypothetical protein